MRLTSDVGSPKEHGDGRGGVSPSMHQVRHPVDLNVCAYSPSQVTLQHEIRLQSTRSTQHM